jgi:hypothetical protein
VRFPFSVIVHLLDVFPSFICACWFGHLFPIFNPVIDYYLLLTWVDNVY